MSAGWACRCPKPDRQWEVTQRRCNHSTFNGSRWTPSRYSEVRCRGCRSIWRTTAAYVDRLPNAGEGWERRG